MCPSEPRVFQIPLDFLVHSREAEVLSVETDTRLPARELHHVSDACGLTGIDKSALRFDHLRISARDDQGATDSFQRRPESISARHIALDEIDMRQSGQCVG